MAGKGITDPSKVTAVMLANAYRKVCEVRLQQLLVNPPIFCTINRCFCCLKKICTYLNLPVISQKIKTRWEHWLYSRDKNSTWYQKGCPMKSHRLGLTV